ncbi:MAG: hypothetical protein ABJ242_05870 [Marinomonas sp.]
MKKFFLIGTALTFAGATLVSAQEQQVAEESLAEAISETAEQVIAEAPPMESKKQVTLQKDTLLKVSPIAEVTSKKMKEGETREFRVAEEISRDGITIVPLNAPVVATVTWRTGKGIFGKSAKYELTFTSVEIDGKTYALAGKHRQEGRGNTAAALLVSGIITGKSAVMVPDQVVNARTAEDITVTAS